MPSVAPSELLIDSPGASRSCPFYSPPSSRLHTRKPWAHQTASHRRPSFRLSHPFSRLSITTSISCYTEPLSCKYSTSKSSSQATHFHSPPFRSVFSCLRRLEGQTEGGAQGRCEGFGGLVNHWNGVRIVSDLVHERQLLRKPKEIISP